MSYLDELEKKLYKPEEEKKPEEKPALSPLPPKFTEFTPKKYDPAMPAGMDLSAPPPSKTRKIFKLFLWTSVIILVAGAFVAFLYQRYFGGKGVLINIDAPQEIMAGEKFYLQIAYQNNSAVVLKNAKIILEMPDDTVYFDSPIVKRIIEISLEDVGKGGKSQKNLPLLIFGEPKTIKHFKASLFYEPSNFKTRISKTTEADIVLSGPIVSIDITLPKEALSKVSFGGEITLRNNSKSAQKDLKVKIEYPLEFRYEKAEPETFSNNNIWAITEILPAESKKIFFRGLIIGKEGNVYKFSPKIISDYNDNSFTIDQKDGIIRISPSLIPLFISLNEIEPGISENYVAKLDDLLTYAIEYQNKTDIGIKDVLIKAWLDGAMFDFSVLNTKGYYDFKNNAITFNGYNTPELSLIKANEKGTVTFQIKTKKQYPASDPQNKNFLLKLKAEMETKSVPPYIDAPELKSSAEITNKVQGQVALECKVLFRDAASKIINKGPMPFKAGQTTNLTMHLKIKNYSTDVKDIAVESGLPQGIEWTGLVKSINTDFAPSYNERTKVVKWEIDKLSAWRGALDAAPEAIFQIAVTPSIYDASKTIIIIGETNLKAKDEFTNSELTWQCPRITNYDLPGYDPTIQDARIEP